MSIRQRLILLAAAAVAVAICAAAAGSYIAVRGELRGQVDDALRANAEALQRVGGPNGPPAIRGRAPERILEQLPKRVRERFPRAGEEPGPPVPFGGAGLLAQFIPASGRPVRMPASERPVPVTGVDRQIAETGSGGSLTDRQVDGQHLRVLTAPLGADDGAVQLARSLDGIDDVLARLRLVLVAIVLGGIGLAAVLAWLVSRRVIAPITDLTEAAEHVSETEDLSRRIEISSGDEVGRLALRFNAMLDTLESSREALASSVQAQRRLVADASHELRTPVASLRTDIESLLKHPELRAEDRLRTLREADARVEELGALIADVIELARGDEPHGAAEDVRLDELVAAAVERMSRMAPGGRFQTRLEPCVVEARPDRLARAVNNLLDNARKYGGSAPIEVTVEDGELSVRDHGPGVLPQELDHVFDRFYRGAGTRGQSGSGLGLAIVRQVAETHGGIAEAENAPAGGAIFRLRLPHSPVEANGDRPRASV